MKRKITKILGVSLALVVLLSLFAIPAAPASAADHAWSTQGIPRTIGITNQMALGTDAAFVEVASNGDIFVVNSQAASATINQIYKSTTGGRTWTVSSAIGGIGTYVLVDLAVSPSYETDSTVIVVGAQPAGAAAVSQVFISTNGGASFAALGGTIPGLAKSIAISPTYSAGSGEIMVGTTDANNVIATYGDVYIWGRSGVLNWTAQTIGSDVFKVAFSPAYPIDATILAITGTAAASGQVQTRVSTNAWNAAAAATTIVAMGGTGDTAPILRADVAFPSDFNFSVPSLRTIYVSMMSATSALCDVFRVPVGGTTVALTATANAGGFREYTSIAFYGTTAEGTLYAGNDSQSAAYASQVRRSTNPTGAAGTIIWRSASAPPTGGGTIALGTTYIQLADDFATSNRMYAATIGAESALSISDDGGVTFYQAGLIDTTFAGINDIAMVSATEFFFVSTDGGAGAESVWKTTDGGATWFRVRAITSAATLIIRVSPEYATDQTIFVGVVGTGVMNMSNNGGATWAARTSLLNIADIVVKDQYNIYVLTSAATGQMRGSVNAGWTWGPPRTVFAIAGSDLELDLGTGHFLAGMANGSVYLSTDGGVVWSRRGAAGAIGGAAGTPAIAFDIDYGNNGIIYAGDNTAATTPGVQRFDNDAPTVAWAAIDGGLCVLPADIVVAADGTLYASDFTAAAAAAGGVVRSLAPTASPAAVAATFEQVSSAGGDSLPAGDTLSILGLAEGSNIILAVNVTTIRAYTDVFAGGTAPAVIAPADASVITAPTGVTFSWEAVDGASTYNTRWSYRADMVGSTVRAAVARPVTTDTTGAGILRAGATVYWQVRVATPVMGPYTDAMSFVTQLAPVAPNAPGVTSPAVGGTGQGGTNAPLKPNFAWGNVPGATAYEFQLSTSSDFSVPLVSVEAATTVYTLPAALEYGTTYYWRVRGVSAAAATAWSLITAFTTLDAPAAPAPPPAPPVVVTSVPAPVITVPPAQPAPIITIPPAPAAEQIAPAYIWAIIIIGAVLVIAVIILIVRTRRAV
ncbi:WD40/YVTN/BNR-like repeat-containing protein [Chloroflexota bacterium]